jgi:Cu-processing system permease protein
VTDGLTAALTLIGAAAAGVCLSLALLGFAVGFWVRDQVRGLLHALGIWFGLLFGIDLLLLALSGSAWAARHPDAWALPLMINPLSALRVTMLFTLERTAPATLDTGPIVGWWLAHAGLWLAGLVTAWTAAMFAASAAGARRRVDSDSLFFGDGDLLEVLR